MEPLVIAGPCATTSAAEMSLMMLAQKCPHCQKAFRIPADYVGRRMRCTGCANSFQIADPAEMSIRPLRPHGAAFILDCRGCGVRLGISQEWALTKNRVKCGKCGNITFYRLGEQLLATPVMPPPDSPRQNCEGDDSDLKADEQCEDPHTAEVDSNYASIPPELGSPQVAVDHSQSKMPKVSQPPPCDERSETQHELRSESNETSFLAVSPASVPQREDSDPLPSVQNDWGSLPSEFLIELARLANRYDKRPTRHLKTLESLFIKRRQVLRGNWDRFRTELRNLVDRVVVDPVKLLPGLETSLRGWRQRTVEKLTRLMVANPLDDGDPLKCGISLFGTMDHGRLERAHTKVLAWFLDPSKEHGFGNALLKALLRALESDASQLTETGIISEAEAIIDGQRRLDILVKYKLNGSMQVLVIEAKVDANEGDAQLKSYDDWLAREFGEEQVLRVFLSPDGRAGESSDKWKPFSFLNLASCFRVALRDLKGKPGHHYLLYYLTGILKDVCHWTLPVPKDGFETCVDPYGFLRYLEIVGK